MTYKLQEPTFGIPSQEIDNDPANIKALAKDLREQGAVFCSWIDHRSTRLDVLLAYDPHRVANYTGGYPKQTIFISVLGYGAYGFAKGFDFEYLCERLKMHPSPTTEALFVLVDGLLDELEK